MEGCWQRLKESRWKVTGVVMVVATVLAAGAAAQHQLSHTSLAVSLPLGDLAAAASSSQESTFSKVFHETDSVEGFLEQPNREASNNLAQITPVKLTQEGTAEVLDGASFNPSTLPSEAGEPFFIVENDVTVEIANDTPLASNEEPQIDTHISDDGAEGLPSAAEVQDAVVTPSEDDSLSTQHSLNAIDETDQNNSSPNDDVEIIDPSVVSGERGAKAINEEVSPQPLAEDSVLQVDQSFGIISEELFTESTPASTLSIEAEFEDLTQRENEVLPTETPVTESFLDLIMDDAPPTDPSATDPQSSEISLDEETPSEVFAKIFAEKETNAPIPLEVVVQGPSPAPVPVRITFNEPASDGVLAKFSVEEATPGQILHNVPESARVSHNLKIPQTQPETDIAEVESSGLENISESPESHNPTQPTSDIPNPVNVATEAARKDSVPPPVTSNAARLADVTPTVQLPDHRNEELTGQLKEAAAGATAAGGFTSAGDTSEEQLEVGRLRNDEVLLVHDLPQGTRHAPEDTANPFAAQTENFNPDPPINAEELAVVPEWIADDSASGETFNHSDIIELPDMPMDDIKVFFLAEDPQANGDMSTEVQGVGVTEVKQQLQKDEVHIAALPDAAPFSPSEVQIAPQVEEAVKDALQEAISAMETFGMKLPDGAAAATIPPAPAPITFPDPAPVPAHISGAPPPPSQPHTLEIDSTFDTSSKPINPAPVHVPPPVKEPVQKPPSEPIERPTQAQVHHPVQEPVIHETPQPNIQPKPAKIQKPAAPPPAPVPPPVPAPAPAPHITEAPALAIIHRPPSSSHSYRPKPKPTRPRPKPTRPKPKPTRPTYRPQPKPTHPPYQPTRPSFRPTKPPAPSTYPPPTASPPHNYKPGHHPISFVNIGEPKPEHFIPDSYHGPIPQLPTSYDDLSSPPRHPPRPSSPPRPAPPPPSYKPPSSTSHKSPSTSFKPPSSISYKPPSFGPYKPPSSTSYKPPATSYKPPSSSSHAQRRPPSHKPRPLIKHPPAAPSSPQYRPPARPKPPSYATHYEKPPATPPKPQYRPPPGAHKPQSQKPILAPVLVPAHLSSLVFPKGVTFSGHKSRPPSLFHLPSFFRTGRKQRLQVPESVVSRLDSDQPDWVDDLEPERR